ncbi:hypothetical protein [Lactobacillus helveticus]|uniref:Uncharacterized protein n=1 Tax=Lactobacillus helveticus TaxID=1587 RepID=A0A8H9KF41_LACHE|nr:hypothetical protein [Lactobacillus helveticus]KRO15669.1 hypothetical protein IV62_GL001536 [Lactobacillus helveticus]GFO98311.1 hypothetical protein LHEH8_00670 [Lactobacillus helveticus]GFP01442.1 hypothetical protein LHEW6_12750 [Lactobacillus helveticus]GFP02723.1 hypothetical protein LHEY10_06520 [Lactobacillus helveticus]GFP05267.1 hypothetical protein LMG22465_12800 [Lactobacillus helveticus]
MRKTIHFELIPNKETQEAIEIAHAEEAGLINDTSKDFTDVNAAVDYLFDDK